MPGSRPAGTRRLVFVNTRAEAPGARPDTTVIVLDTAWTPMPGERSDLVALRPIVGRIVAGDNLFAASLDLLDEWADLAGVPARFEVRGVGWWSHARSFVSLVLHELLLWRLILDEIEPADGSSEIVLPPRRRWLAAAAGAGHGAKVKVNGRGAVASFAWRRERSMVRAARAAWHVVNPFFRRSVAAREGILDARVTVMRAGSGMVLAPMRETSFHTVRTAAGHHRGDPYAGPVLDRLGERGITAQRIVLGLSHRRHADWPAIESDDQVLPWDYVAQRWGRAGGSHQVGSHPFGSHALGARLAAIPDVPLRVGHADLGPIMRDFVASQGRWLSEQAASMDTIERLIEELRPSALLTGWEASRTAWLGAARRSGVPVVAVQHGVIYPKTPDYVRPRDPALVRADMTCLFGAYERDLLVDAGGYAPASVVATGSPRAAPDSAVRPVTDDERDAVRRRLGVHEGDRLLVVSTARRNVGDVFHSMAMAGRLLAGPFPGVHIAFKLHPEERDGSHYLALLAGQAIAGGYPAPRMSVIRDIDIYRLLRVSDAHLGQYSTVLTDAVLTSTPNMVAVGQAWADIIGYATAGVAVPVATADDVRSFMANPVAPQPDARARFLADHFLDGDAVGRIADVVTGVMAR